MCLVTPWRTSDHGRRDASASGPAARAGAGFSTSSINESVCSTAAGGAPATVTPDRFPSSASLASRSACLFCSRGTHVYVVPNGARRLASTASGRMSGCLIFQLPDICSTTSLESIRTSMSASGASSAAIRSPAISPEYSATLLVATPIVVPSSAITAPVSASLSTAPYADGPGLPREPPSASITTERGAPTV